ncbi:MAG: alanine racemase [Planctomycetota bacterium]
MPNSLLVWQPANCILALCIGETCNGQHMRSPHIQVTINLDQIRLAAEAIHRRTGVKLIAVIKADAYGLGAVPVADALASMADEFAYFSIEEARALGRPGIVLGPPEGDPAEYRRLNVRPAITTSAAAQRFAGLPVALNMDSGMQRFGCRPEEIDDLFKRCQVADVFTHAVTLAHARLLRTTCQGKPVPIHAAATSLLDTPEAWLDAVRPGLALYRGAVRVHTRLKHVRETTGGAGYSGFECRHVGVILGGYSNLLSPGPVLVNGRRQRLIEAGMNTSFVSVDPTDRIGAEVILLGDSLDEAELAAHFNCREHEILCRYTSMGARGYVTAD